LEQHITFDFVLFLEWKDFSRKEEEGDDAYIRLSSPPAWHPTVTMYNMADKIVTEENFWLNSCTGE
jgi:hypothetical protein